MSALGKSGHPSFRTSRLVLIRSGHRKGQVHFACGGSRLTSPNRRPILERIPSRTVGELEPAEIGSKPQSDSRADWHDDDTVSGKCRHAETANEISRSVDAAKAIENCSSLRKAVNKHHRPCTVSSEIK